MENAINFKRVLYAKLTFKKHDSENKTRYALHSLGREVWGGGGEGMHTRPGGGGGGQGGGGALNGRGWKDGVLGLIGRMLMTQSGVSCVAARSKFCWCSKRKHFFGRIKNIA